MLAYPFLLVLSLLSTLQVNFIYGVPHRLVVLISTPRSLSTIFSRMMEGRGDCRLFDEPGIDAYTALYTPQFSQTICTTHAPKTFEEAEERILNALSQDELVFVKEMGYVANEYLLKSKLRQAILQQGYGIFLVRHPHQVLISFYKKFPELFEQLSEWLSYETVYHLYEEMKTQAVHKPLIILSDELVNKPAATVEYFCEYVGIPFNVHQLNWQPLATTMPADHIWNNEVCAHWYDRVLQSTGFESITTYALDPNGELTFEEIPDLHHREIYKKLYGINMPYYQKFLQEHALQNF